MLCLIVGRNILLCKIVNTNLEAYFHLARNRLPIHWDTPGVMSMDFRITTEGMEMSATAPALVGPGVPQLPLDRFGNLYATVSGTGPGLGVVDWETNVRDKLAIASLHGRIARIKRCWPNITVLYIYNYARLTEIRLSCLVCAFVHRRVQIQCVQQQWSLFCEMQENRGTKRGYCQIGWWWCHCLRCCVSALCWAPAHDSWLTEWSRLHRHPIDDSLVSSAHTLAYGENYLIQDDNSPCHRVAIVQEWKAQHDVRTLRQLKVLT